MENTLIVNHLIRWEASPSCDKAASVSQGQLLVTAKGSAGFNGSLRNEQALFDSHLKIKLKSKTILITLMRKHDNGSKSQPNKKKRKEKVKHSAP